MSPGAVLGKLRNSQKVKLLQVQSQLLWTPLGNSNYLITMFMYSSFKFIYKQIKNSEKKQVDQKPLLDV